MKHTKKPSRPHDFLDALADVIADRVAAKVNEASKPPTTPERVPLWLAGPRQPRGRRPPIEGKWTIDKAFRSAGMVKLGDPGYDEALKGYLEWRRRHDAELHARAQMRKAAKLLEELVTAASRSSAAG